MDGIPENAQDEYDVTKYVLLSQRIQIPRSLVAPETGCLMVSPVFIEGVGGVSDVRWLAPSLQSSGVVVPNIALKYRIFRFVCAIQDLIPEQLHRIRSVLSFHSISPAVVLNVIEATFPGGTFCTQEVRTQLQKIVCDAKRVEHKECWRRACQTIKRVKERRVKVQRGREKVEREEMVLYDRVELSEARRAHYPLLNYLAACGKIDPQIAVPESIPLLYAQSLQSGPTSAMTLLKKLGDAKSRNFRKKGKRRGPKKTILPPIGPQRKPPSQKVEGAYEMPVPAGFQDDGYFLSSEEEGGRCVEMNPFRALFCPSLKRQQQNAKLARRDTHSSCDKPNYSQRSAELFTEFRKANDSQNSQNDATSDHSETAPTPTPTPPPSQTPMPYATEPSSPSLRYTQDTRNFRVRVKRHECDAELTEEEQCRQDYCRLLQAPPMEGGGANVTDAGMHPCYVPMTLRAGRLRDDGHTSYGLVFKNNVIPTYGAAPLRPRPPSPTLRHFVKSSKTEHLHTAPSLISLAPRKHRR